MTFVHIDPQDKHLFRAITTGSAHGDGGVTTAYTTDALQDLPFTPLPPLVPLVSDRDGVEVIVMPGSPTGADHGNE